MWKPLAVGLAGCWIAACAPAARQPPKPPTSPGAAAGNDLCREELNRDREASCRELRPLSNPALALTGPDSGPYVPTLNREASMGLFDNWPAGTSPREIGVRVAKNYLARPLVLGAPMHYAEA